MDVDTGLAFPASTHDAARNCVLCPMRIKELATTRQMHDEYERDVRKEHITMLRELRACKEVLETNGLLQFVRAILHRDYPDQYSDPTGIAPIEHENPPVGVMGTKEEEMG